MEKVKDDNKLQIQLKIDKIKDREIFNVLNMASNKSDFIKDAIFYFMYHIEQGKVINRNYPYNKVNIKLDIVEEKEDIIKAKIINEPEIKPHEDEYDEDDDNFDDVDI